MAIHSRMGEILHNIIAISSMFPPNIVTHFCKISVTTIYYFPLMVVILKKYVLLSPV